MNYFPLLKATSVKEKVPGVRLPGEKQIVQLNTRNTLDLFFLGKIHG